MTIPGMGTALPAGSQVRDDRHEVWQIADALQKELRSAQATLTALRARLAALELPDQQRVECVDCGLRLSGALTLAEHRYHSHAGPEPEHWIELESRIAPDEEAGATG